MKRLLYLFIVLPFVFIIVLLFVFTSCQKEYSFEGSTCNMSHELWDILNGTRSMRFLMHYGIKQVNSSWLIVSALPENHVFQGFGDAGKFLFFFLILWWLYQVAS